MKKKPKHREQVEQLIMKGYKAGMCDTDGNSITAEDGRFVAKPRLLGQVSYKAVYHKDGTVDVFENGQWRTEKWN